MEYRRHAYVQAMLRHHQQAQHLASLVEGRTTRPEPLRLALGIRTAQSSDLSRMAAWLHARGSAAADAIVDPTTEPEDRWFTGMMATTQLRTLAASAGQRFDFLFVDMLLEHHKGAVVMADEVLTGGHDAEVRLLANRARRHEARGGVLLTAM
jgi:uncharacterized protein (DUF305 family)